MYAWGFRRSSIYYCWFQSFYRDTVHLISEFSCFKAKLQPKLKADLAQLDRIRAPTYLWTANVSQGSGSNAPPPHMQHMCVDTENPRATGAVYSQ